MGGPTRAASEARHARAAPGNLHDADRVRAHRLPAESRDQLRERHLSRGDGLWPVGEHLRVHRSPRRLPRHLRRDGMHRTGVAAEQVHERCVPGEPVRRWPGHRRRGLRWQRIRLEDLPVARLLPSRWIGLHSGLQVRHGTLYRPVRRRHQERATCFTAGYYAAPGLACKSDCTFETKACGGGHCGDGIINGLEQCDGTTFKAASCDTVGFHGATTGLKCSKNCRYTATSCQCTPTARCPVGQRCDCPKTGGCGCVAAN
jgi:hypothetical protein